VSGRLALARGVLWVGRHAGAAHLRAYDLDGRPLGPGFSFRDGSGRGSSVVGLAVDADRGLWVADGRASCVRRFTVFGREQRVLAGGAGADRDARGALGDLADLALLQDEQGEQAPRLLVACGGWRRHALQVLDEEGRWLDSLRSEGDPREPFRGVSAAAARGRWIAAAEGGRGQVQVFRDGQFHFLVRPTPAGGGAGDVTAVAVLEDGRMVVGLSGGEARSALLLLDKAGRLAARLADGGSGHGQVLDPLGLAVEPGRDDRQTRLAVLDRDAERVQVLSLDGRCFGELTDLPGASA
jgi:hypothetical protein